MALWCIFNGKEDVFNSIVFLMKTYLCMERNRFLLQSLVTGFYTVVSSDLVSIIKPNKK